MKRMLSLVLALTLCLGLALPVRAAESAGFADTENHYAKEAVETWSGYGVLKGYPDGSFQPDGTITRAEMAAVLDRVMGYQNTVENTFTDVPDKAWYAQSVFHLVAEGILQGRQEGLMLPNDPITRQEAFAALARSLSLEKSEKAPGFTDDKDIAPWALGYVSAMKEAGYIQGDKAGTIRPGDAITRAEVVTILNRMALGFVNVDGEYSADCKGNLVVNAKNVKLKDMTIDGDLIVADGVGDGDVSIEKVTVKGDIILRGCGENSFHILPGCNVKNVIVTKTTKGIIRLVNESGKTIPMVWVDDAKAGVTLDGGTFNEIIVACDAPVTVKAKTVKTLSVTGNATLTVSKDATVSSLELTETAKEAKVTVEGKVTELINDADAEITNKGTVASNVGTPDSTPTWYPTSSKKKETLSEVTIQLRAPHFGDIPAKPGDPLKAGYSTQIQWFNADGSAPSFRVDGSTFTANQAYKAVVKLIPTTGYVFAENVKATVTDSYSEYPNTVTVDPDNEKNRLVTIEYAPTANALPVEGVRIERELLLKQGEKGMLTVNYTDNLLTRDITYQWYTLAGKGGPATPIPGATERSYRISEGVGTYYYRCEVKAGEQTATSNEATVMVKDILDPNTVPQPTVDSGYGQFVNQNYGFEPTFGDLIKHANVYYVASASIVGTSPDHPTPTMLLEQREIIQAEDINTDSNSVRIHIQVPVGEQLCKDIAERYPDQISEVNFTETHLSIVPVYIDEMGTERKLTEKERAVTFTASDYEEYSHLPQIYVSGINKVDPKYLPAPHIMAIDGTKEEIYLRPVSGDTVVPKAEYYYTEYGVRAKVSFADGSEYTFQMWFNHTVDGKNSEWINDEDAYDLMREKLDPVLKGEQGAEGLGMQVTTYFGHSGHQPSGDDRILYYYICQADNVIFDNSL